MPSSANTQYPISNFAHKLAAFTALLFLLTALSGCAQPAEPERAAAQPTTPTEVALLTSTATATPHPSPTPTRPPTFTPTATLTPSPTLSPTSTITPTPLPTPGPTPDGVFRQARVPILMYHYISEPPPDAHPYRTGNSLAPDTFAAHLDYLQAEGYTTIPLKDLISHLAAGSPDLPEKPIILTFDDGYEDNYLNAFPLLQARDMTATLFIVTDAANRASDDEPAFDDYANWTQLAEMAAAGMEIGSHSFVHIGLSHKDLDYLVFQALRSSENIETNIGYHPHILAYPGGDYDPFAIDVFRSAHYWGAVTTQQGTLHDSDHLMELKRIRISNETGAQELSWLLDYEWPE